MAAFRAKYLKRELWDCAVRLERERYQSLTANTLSIAGRRGAWRRWHKERAIVDLMPTVARIARDVRRMFAAHLDVRDLVAAGNLGLVKAAATYDPAAGDFAPYAWFRVRGAIIDSQKRRTYREEGHVSLQAIEAQYDGWLPRQLTTDRAARADETYARTEQRRRLMDTIRALPAVERHILASQLDGRSIQTTAAECGRSISWTRARLVAARNRVTAALRTDPVARVTA